MNDETIVLASSVARAVAAVARTTSPPPSGGSIAAAAGALAAALTQMVAGLTAGRPKYADVAAEMERVGQRAAALADRLSQLVSGDAEAYGAVGAAYAMPRAAEEERAARTRAIQQAMRGATEAPLEIARLASEVAHLAADVAGRGNVNAVADAAVAAILADAVSRAAALTVRANVPVLEDQRLAARWKAEAIALAGTAGAASARAVAAAERAP